MIYTNAIEEANFSILMQCDDQGNEKPVAYMSQSLFDDEFKYSFIEKHAFTLVKAVEKFHHFILGKNTLVKSLYLLSSFFSNILIFQGTLHIGLPRFKSMI